MASRLQIQGEDSILLRVTHSNIKSFSADVGFSPQMTVEAVKEKLWKKCGTSVDLMSLELYDDTGFKVSVLGDNMKPFGYYSPQDGMLIVGQHLNQLKNLCHTNSSSSFQLHIIDLDPSSVTSGGWLEDTSLVEKYKISEEAYAKLDGNYRKYKEKLRLQHPSNESKIGDNYMEDLCENIKIGDRCEIEPGEKSGVVKFVGRAETLAPGFWVGVQFDEPLGKHDGTVKGKRYFDCPSLCGGMVRPDRVKVGDFRERDAFDEEEI